MTIYFCKDDNEYLLTLLPTTQAAINWKIDHENHVYVQINDGRIESFGTAIEHHSNRNNSISTSYIDGNLPSDVEQS